MAEGRELNDIKTDSKGDNLLDVKFDPLDCDKLLVTKRGDLTCKCGASPGQVLNLLK